MGQVSIESKRGRPRLGQFRWPKLLLWLVLGICSGQGNDARAQDTAADRSRGPVLGFELGVGAPTFSVGALLRRIGERGFVIAPPALSSAALRVVANQASPEDDRPGNALRVELVHTSRGGPAQIVEFAEVQAGAPAVVELRLQHTIIALLESHRPWLLRVSRAPKRMFRIKVVGEGTDDSGRTRVAERLTSALWRAGHTLARLDDRRSEVVCVGLRGEAVHLSLQASAPECLAMSAFAGRPVDLSLSGWGPIEDRLIELARPWPNSEVPAGPPAATPTSRARGATSMAPQHQREAAAVEAPTSPADDRGLRKPVRGRRQVKPRQTTMEPRMSYGGPWTLDLRLGGAWIYRSAFDPWFSGESCLVRDPGHGLCIGLRATPTRRLRPVMIRDAALMAWVHWSVAVHPKLRLQPQLGGGLAVHSHREPSEAWRHELDPQVGLRMRLMVHLGEFFDMTVGVAGFFARRSRAHRENGVNIWERHAFMVGPELSLGTRWSLK